MNRTQPSGDHRPLPLLHMMAMFGLALGWLYYCWRETSLRYTGPKLGLDLDQAVDLLTRSLGDFLLGLCTVLLFALGTGIYVRRVQVWLDARSSGQAVAYGSADLKDQALAANDLERGGG
jgi:hypothetical protein